MPVVDIIIVVAYMAVSLIVGIVFRGRQKDVDDYFQAGGTLGGAFGSMLVGLSIAATFFSGLSFVAYPSVVYSQGLQILMGITPLPLIWVFLRFWFIPRYLGVGNRTPYDVVEAHFGLAIRKVVAGLYLLLRLGWMAALIYAPTLVILTVGKLPQDYFWPLVLLLGGVSTLYTTIGGVRGVIITDAIQFIVIAGGLVLVMVHVLLHLPVPLVAALRDLSELGHFEMLDFRVSPTVPFTFWSVVIGMGIGSLAAYTADQMTLQRLLAAGNVQSASRSFLINIIGVAVVVLLLAGTGVLLAAWYRYSPDPSLPTVADRVFPHFVTTQLPSGVTGMLIAAILAATMSSMTSGINAVAGVLTNDFWLRSGKARTPNDVLWFARCMSFAVGLIATLCAGVVDRLGTIFDIAQILLGVFYGPLLAVILLSVGQIAIGRGWVIGGVIVGCALGWITAFSPVASLWVAPASLAGAFGVVAIGIAYQKIGPPRNV